MFPPWAPFFCELTAGVSLLRGGKLRSATAHPRRSAAVGSTLSEERGVSSAGRAPPLQGGGHRFDPGTLH